MLTQAEERLGLSKTALASICNVSRQTIYAWLSGENEPAPENTAALQRLARLSSRADVTAHPLKRRWTRVTSEEDDLTLRDVLSASEPDEQRALALIEELVERSQAWDHQREKRLSEASEKEERKTTRRALADLSRPVSTE